MHQRLTLDQFGHSHAQFLIDNDHLAAGHQAPPTTMSTGSSTRLSRVTREPARSSTRSSSGISARPSTIFSGNSATGMATDLRACAYKGYRRNRDLRLFLRELVAMAAADVCLATAGGEWSRKPSFRSMPKRLPIGQAPPMASG